MTPIQFQSKSIIDVNPSHCYAVPTLLVDVLRTGLVGGGHEEARSVQPKDKIHHVPKRCSVLHIASSLQRKSILNCWIDHHSWGSDI